MLRRRTSLYAVAVCCLLIGNAKADEPASSNWLARIRLLPGENERSHRTIKAAFRKAVSDANECTVSLHADGAQVALGTIIDPNGYVVTKASELRTSVACHLSDGRQLTATLVAIHPDYDLALLKVEASRLRAVRWGDSSQLAAAVGLPRRA